MKRLPYYITFACIVFILASFIALFVLIYDAGAYSEAKTYIPLASQNFQNDIPEYCNQVPYTLFNGYSKIELEPGIKVPLCVLIRDRSSRTLLTYGNTPGAGSCHYSQSTNEYKCVPVCKNGYCASGLQFEEFMANGAVVWSENGSPMDHVEIFDMNVK